MLIAHSGLAPAPLAGGIGAANVREGATSVSAGELPQLPQEHIGAEFVERAVAATAAQAPPAQH